jgi:hypothetical protein
MAPPADPRGNAGEVYDLWGNRDETSMFKEVGDSAETKHDNDMYVASKMADWWKEIHWLQINKRCWKATYGPDTQVGIPP